MACEIRRDFIELARPAPGWDIHVSIEEDYQHTLMEIFKFYLWLVGQKLQQPTERPIAYQVEVMEEEWVHLRKVVGDIEGGKYELLSQYSQQTPQIITHLAVITQPEMCGPKDYDDIRAPGLSRWINNVLKALPLRMLKLQNILRVMHNALINSIDFRFTNPQAILDRLARLNYVLIDTNSSWEQNASYIIGSPDIINHPHFAVDLMGSCAADDHILDELYNGCHLIVVRTDIPIEWSGAILSPHAHIPYIPLDISFGRMRLISPGPQRLERHIRTLQSLGVVSMHMPLYNNNSTSSSKLSSDNTAYLEESRQHGKKKGSTRNYLSFPLCIPLIGRPHMPKIQTRWNGLVQTLSELLDIVVEYPYMIRSPLHLEYHQRCVRNSQRCDQNTKSHSSTNSNLSKGSNMPALPSTTGHFQFPPVTAN